MWITFAEKTMSIEKKAYSLGHFSNFAAILKILHPQCIAIPVHTPPEAMPCWWALIRVKQLSMAATARDMAVCMRGLVYMCLLPISSLSDPRLCTNGSWPLGTRLSSCLHYFQGNFRLCERIKFNLFFINYWTTRAYR